MVTSDRAGGYGVSPGSRSGVRTRAVRSPAPYGRDAGLRTVADKRPNRGAQVTHMEAVRMDPTTRGPRRGPFMNLKHAASMLGVALMATLVLAPAASATYPNRNGLIAFGQHRRRQPDLHHPPERQRPPPDHARRRRCGQGRLVAGRPTPRCGDRYRRRRQHRHHQCRRQPARRPAPRPRIYEADLIHPGRVTDRLRALRRGNGC